MPGVIARRAAMAAAGTALALLVAGCDAGPGAITTATTGGLSAQTATAGPVEVTVVPQRVDATGAVFRVELSNHQVDLTGDYAATSTLTVDATAWQPARWSGAGPGGHHRDGTLTFTSTGRAGGVIELRPGGLPAPVTLRWTLPGAGS